MIIKQLNKFMEDTLFYDDLPGLAIGISIGEHADSPYAGLDYQNAVGYKNFITKEPLLPEHIFHMASVTKLFVGISIMQLYERGLLDLGARAVDIIPWLHIGDIRYKSITIRHLLTHTAGLADVQDYGWDRPELDEGALKRYVQSSEVTGSKLLWDPSENKFLYSNIGYEILGTIIEAVSSLSFEDYVAEHILRPLGMTDSTLLTFERTEKLGIMPPSEKGQIRNLQNEQYVKDSLKLENLSKVGLAMPHIKNAEKRIILEPQYPYNRGHGPSSTLTTNISDIKKWAAVHLNHGAIKSDVKRASESCCQILKPETYKEMWTEYALVPNNGEHIGLSWFKREQNGYTLYGHEGNDDGFRASFWICPELNAHIVVAANMSKAPVKKMNKKAFDLLTVPSIDNIQHV